MINPRWFTLGSTLAVASLLAGCGGGAAGNLAPSIANPASAFSAARSTRSIESSPASSYKTLYSFAGEYTDGSNPTSTLLSYGGVLYGTTGGGGTTGDGTIFSITTSGAETDLYNFSNLPDGSAPFAGLTAAWNGKSNLLYGTTFLGGTLGAGTVFSYNPATKAETVVYNFGTNGATDASAPSASLTEYDCNLYGTTTGGGTSNEGTVFKINPKTGTETVIHSFGTNGVDGTIPYAGLTVYNGYLYGTTALGGANGQGAVFKINPNNGAESVVYSFKGGTADGAEPSSSLAVSGNMLYGTTTMGGAAGLGTIFSVNPSSGAETVLHSFAGAPADGNQDCNPSSGLKGRSGGGHGCFHSFWSNNGTLYGATCFGGTDNFGTIYAYNIAKKSETVLYSFGTSGASDGQNPQANVTQIGNTLYGTTAAGGSAGAGTVYAYTL
jgi:uncharacterized repeat protein (TIGR03803 family)